MCVFAVPDAFVKAGYLQGIDLYLWYAFIALCAIACIFFLLRMSRSESKTQKHLYVGYALLCLGYAVTRVFFIVAVFVPDQYDFYTELGYVPGIVGGIALIFVAELHLIPQTKKVITILLMAALALCIIGVAGTYSRDIVYYLVVGVSLLAVVFIIVIYIYLLKMSTGNIRNKTAGAFIGLLLIGLGAIADSQIAYTSLGMITIVPPLLMIAGTLFFITFQRAD